MSSGPTAESFDFCSACLSSKSEKGWLYSSVLSDVNFTVVLFIYFYLFIYLFIYLFFILFAF